MMQIYLDSVFAEAPVHGLFSIRKTRDGLKKQPMGEHGCASFNVRAAEVKTSKTALLGRAFGAGDGVIGIDVDGSKPEPAWHSSTGYREVSASGNGLHIIARVPAELIPTQGSKIVLKGNSEHDIEIFYGRNNGIALTGTDATYTVPDLDMYSPAGRIVKEEFEKKNRQIEAPAKANKSASPKTKNTSIIPPADLNGVLASVAKNVQEWAVLNNKTIPFDDPSKAFQSVCTRIAGDLGEMEAIDGRDGILTITNIQRIWETTEPYHEFYEGEEKYAPHKIEPTLQKALIYGQKRKAYMQSALNMFNRKSTKSESKPQQSQKQEPEKPKHPEGYCVSEEGIPEFWCDEYPHPLRYHMAHLARYAQTAMQQPNAITAWICAVFFGTAVCARQYAAELAPFGRSDSSALIFPRLYAIVSGISGAGKDDIHHGLIALTAAIAEGSANANLWGMMASAGNWTSDAAVHATIAEHPQSIAVWDECGHKIRRAKSDPIAASMLSKLTEAFSRANDVLKAPQYANPKDQQLPKGKNIWHPAMSVIGLGTPSQMDSITEDMIEDGQFARFLFYTIPHRKHEKPLQRVEFNFKTHGVINEILATATFTPDMKMATRQQVCKVLHWQPDAPRQGWEVRASIRELAIAAKSSSDAAILNRVFEIGGVLAISRTILGTKHGQEAEYVPYDTMMECIEEAKKSMWKFHDIIVDAPVYTPRELRIADTIEEIFREELGTPFRAYYGRDIAPRLKKHKLEIGGARGERQNIDAILLTRGIAAGKEGNTPTGRKYYYNSITETAQAEQDEFDAKLKTAAKFQNHPS